MSDIYESVGKTIKLYRKKLGMTQAKLSEIADLSANFIGQIERGTKKASLETIRRIADAMQIPINKLFDNILRKEASKIQNRKILHYKLSKVIEDVLKDNKVAYSIGKTILKKLNQSR